MVKIAALEDNTRGWKKPLAIGRAGYKCPPSEGAWGRVTSVTWYSTRVPDSNATSSDTIVECSVLR